MRNYVNLRQPALVFLAAGAILGLVLGLLIGWVFWPVEWAGATLRDLYPSEKAEYISAVADAFVIYDSPEAAEVALRRLSALDDGTLPQTFQESLSYFATSTYSDKAIRDSNIRRLALALNLPGLTTAPQAVATDGEAAQPTVAPALTPVTAAEESSGGLGWLGWLLWFLTAVLLLAGGLFILRKAGLPDLQALLKARTQAARPPDEDEVDEFEEPAVAPRRGQPNARLVSPQGATPADYSFDQEDDDNDWQDNQRPTNTRPARYATLNEVANRYDDDDDDLFAGDPAEDEFNEDDYLDEDDNDTPFEEEDESAWRSPGKSYTIDVNKEDPPPSGGASTYSAPASSSPDARSRFQDVDTEPDRSSPDEQTPKAALSTAVATQRATANRVERPAAIRARNKVIDQHVFHYQAGMLEYDESRPIVDPQSGKYIGEFGMGASDKNAMMQIGPHQLVALEVWIFDKSDERSLGNQTRILLSEYAVDHNLDQLFLKERQDNPRPFTAQPGVHFQLESQNLLLDCTIIDVVYSTNSATKGIFQEITIDMAVQQKG